MKISKWLMFLLIFVVLGHKSVGHCHLINENHCNDHLLCIQNPEIHNFLGNHCQGEYINNHLEDFTCESVLKIKQLLFDCNLPNTTPQNINYIFYKSEFSDLILIKHDLFSLNNYNLRAPPI